MPARISSREKVLEAVIARSTCDEAIQTSLGAMDCFAEPVIGRRFCSDPLARNDGEKPRYLLPGSEIIRLATSLFQMNSTSSAPMVAVMKPAP
jgi:hypothetical protein